MKERKKERRKDGAGMRTTRMKTVTQQRRFYIVFTTCIQSEITRQ